MNALTHPYQLAPVLLAKVRAMTMWCPIAPSPHGLADEIDNLLDGVSEEAVYAVTKPVLGMFSAAEKLSDMEFAAKKACGAEPYFEPHYAIDYVNGGHHERGDGAAWERWLEEHDAAAIAAGKEFRTVMAAMLRAVAGVLGNARMRDPCKAGLWDIAPASTCPICGALPDTTCGRVG